MRRFSLFTVSGLRVVPDFMSFWQKLSKNGSSTFTNRQIEM